MDSSPLYDEAIDSQVGAKKPSWTHQRRGALAGWASLILSLMACLLFVGAGMGITADRRERIPVVTWKRTAAPFSVAACLASWTAFGMASYSLGPKIWRLAPGWFAMFLSVTSNEFFIMYLVAMYED